MTLRPVLWALAALASATALVQGCAAFVERPAAAGRLGAGGHPPVIFVPGVTGTQLRDPASGELVWGATTQLLRPRDGGYRLVLPLLGPRENGQDNLVASGPLLRLRLPFWTKPIYQPLLDHFLAAGYRHGDLESPGPSDDFFFFNYDWRHGNLDAVRRLDRQLEALAAARGGAAVDLICQSNAAKICRWLAKYGALDADQVEAGETFRRGYTIRSLVLAGASNRGALRGLRLLNSGRTYVPLVGRRFQPETFFSLRPLFEDLPATGEALFFDSRGESLPVDLFEAGNWVEYGWSVFAPDASDRLRRGARSDLFGDPALRLDYLRTQLRQSQRLQRLLAADSAQFPPVSYYLLENTSSPTIARALLVRENGSWKTYFLGDPPVDRDPRLKRLAAAPGDGHAIAASQRGLSPQEAAALATTVSTSGGHFDAIIQPAALGAMLGFLADPENRDPGEPPT